MKFRKKPVVIEARQFKSKEEIRDLLDWIENCGGRVGSWDWSDSDKYILIDTLEGAMKASAGDWIIRGVKGEFYPCKPDIFEATYEAVSDGEGAA